ncbi:MAG: DUF4221 family protein [Cyclobacterium sp.]|uniref:DUF4221 family protein n=1 Tax=unclassified Cyclobacterium TaxID=2615055 RepID=UPI0013D0A3E1|nr:DUF4221 family protein [Cyclobacterium sp. SYSU L10401]
MRLFVFLFFASLLIGCEGRDTREKNGEVRLDFSLDTVMVDPGQEILFLNSGLNQAQLSPDKKYLYNFNPTDFSIEKINLDELKFEDKINLSKEGPNGVGQYVMGFLLVDETSILFRSYNQDNFLDWDGNKKRQFDFKKVGAEAERIVDGEHLFMPVIQPGKPQVFFGLVSNWEQKTTALAVFDLGKDHFKRIDVPLFEKTSAFKIEFNDGQMGYVMGTSEYVKCEGGKVILGAEVSSDLYVYDPLTGVLDQRAFESELTANEKKGNHPGKVSDRKEMEGIYRRIHEEIGFHAVHWDEKNELYYRFSSMAEFSDTAETPENRMVPSPTGAKVYLTVFDKDLNQIAESRVPMLTNKPAYHFAKDGKIWIFENMEDEMGFVRMSISDLPIRKS